MATESFFSSASLALLASAGAGKDGKAYSIKPNDGTGDFTFSRGSNLAATRVGADGLIEKGRENLLKQSNQLDTTWNHSGTLTSGQTGYDGSSDAWRFENPSPTSSLYQSNTSSGVQTMSAYFKKNATYGVRFFAFGSSNSNTFFDLNNGLVVKQNDTIDASIEPVGTDWFRCSMTFNQTNTRCDFYVTNNAQVQVLGEFTIQDAQLEIGLAATDVISTGATTGKAGLLEDEPRFDYSGGATCPSLLLEPSRTNLFTQSEYFDGWAKTGASVSNNTTTSPEGETNAATITGTGSYDRIYQVVDYTAGDYTFSVFVKKTDTSQTFAASFGPTSVDEFSVNLNTGVKIYQGSNISSVYSVSYGDYWRVIATSTRGNETLRQARIFAGYPTNINPIIWGAQLEQGSYPTSYIPNHSGGSVTRGGDVLGNSNNISGLFNDNKGTLYFETDDTIFKGEINNYNFFGLTESSSGSYFRFRGSNSTILVQSGGFGSTISFNPNGATFTKYLYKWDGTNIKIFIDGVERGSVSQTATFNPDLFRIGFNFGFVSNTKQLLIFPTALSDADCITLTTL